MSGSGASAIAMPSDRILVAEVDFGGSEGEYANRFRKAHREVDRRVRFDVDVTPHRFPSCGRRGKRVMRVLMFRPGNLDTDDALRDAIAGHGIRGEYLHPYELLSLCAEYRGLGLEYPLLSSPDHVWEDPNGNRFRLLVSSIGPVRGVEMSSPADIGWSDRCRFPVALS